LTSIIGLGLDLIDLEHFAIHYGDFDSELLARCFTTREVADVGDRVDRLARLAGRFAIKEATFKALGGGAGISHLDIETVSGDDGAPHIHLSGSVRALAETRRAATFLVSVSHSASSAAAVVIACAGAI